MDETPSPFLPPEGDHPVKKVLEQIASLLAFLEKNKNKPISDAPDWLLTELTHVEQQFTQLKELMAKNSPSFELSDEKIKEIIDSLPPEFKQYISKTLTQAKSLQERAVELRQNWHKHQEPVTETIAQALDVPDEQQGSKERPMELLGKEQENDDETRRAAIQHRKKFGRMGGRKNWKPL